MLSAGMESVTRPAILLGTQDTSIGWPWHVTCGRPENDAEARAT